MLESAPDSAVRNLDTALSGDKSNSLAAVRAIVRAEASDRILRDVVLGPLVPLCAPRQDGFRQAQFPLGALSRLWKGLRALEPRTIAVVASSLTLDDGDDDYPPEVDGLCRVAAGALSNGDAAMAPLIRFLEDGRSGAATEFSRYVALIPLARQGVKSLPDWLRKMTADHAATIRLLFKDASAVAPDAAPRLLEILLAHCDEPWKLLRVISAMTKRGGDRYLSSSEMAEFCERLMDDMEKRVAALRRFDEDHGPEAAVEANRSLAIAICEITEFEKCLDLSKEGPWGQRILKQKGALSGLAEGFLKRAPKVLSEALPSQSVRGGGGNLRSEPRLDHAPDPQQVRRAMTSLAFFERCRSNAANGGYGSIRAKAGEEITQKLNGYVEDLLSLVHGGEAANLDHARAFLEVAADFVGLVQDDKAAQIVRRRAAAAI